MLMKNPRGGFVRSVQATVAGAVVIVAILATAAVVGFHLLGNPFTTVTKDRTPPPVLLELRDLAEFHAARAQFEVTVDIEHDVKWVPSFVAGDRVQFVAVGTVDAVADFRALDASALTIDEDTSTVTVRLGAVQVQPPVLDHELSHVMNRDRGLINRIGGMFSDNPTSEASLYRKAEDKIAAAATKMDLVTRAEENVTQSLTTLIHALGYEHVDVRFASAA
jgi:Protein of unknown function (DUF4230)